MIAGNDLGGLSAALERARALGIRGQVTVTGLLRGADRLEALAAADVVVYPSSDEVFGLVPPASRCWRVQFPSSLAMTPVPRRWWPQPGRCGRAPQDPAALAVAIANVLDAREAWRREARAAATRVRALFGTDTVVSTLDAVYHDVLAGALRASA